MTRKHGEATTVWQQRRRVFGRFAMLLPVLALIHLVAYLLRFEGHLDADRWRQMSSTLVWALAVKSLVFAWHRIYQSWNRYLTFYDLVVLCQSATLSSMLLIFCDYLFLSRLAIPRSVFLMDWGATIVCMGGLRGARRWMQEGSRLFDRIGDKTPVFIIGTNDYGEALLRTIRRSRHLDYHVVGFIADSQQAVDASIGGVRVVGTVPHTCQRAQEYGVRQVLIASGNLTGKQVRQLVHDGARAKVAVKVLPGYEQLLDGSVDLSPRTVSIADLLRRESVQLDMKQLHQWLDERVLMVTGAAGSIGSEICRQLLQFHPRKLVLVDRAENGQFFLERELAARTRRDDLHVCIADIGDALRIKTLLRDYRPDIVFHAAAYKHVPLMEGNCSEAVKNIVLATQQLADLADQHGVGSLVMISTDKAVNPTSVMGACKRVAELYVQALAETSACRFVTVRFGNVLDSAGSVVPIFRDQIARGGPVTVTHPEMRRFFMTIPEASQLVIQAGAMGQGGEVFVLDMGEPVRIVDLAQDMIRLSGLRVGDDIEVQFTGIRPGEKLFEELHVGGETHLPTSHPKITVAASEKRDMKDVAAALSRLRLLVNHPADEIITELTRIVPQFRPTRPQLGDERRGAA